MVLDIEIDIPIPGSDNYMRLYWYLSKSQPFYSRRAHEWIYCRTLPHWDKTWRNCAPWVVIQRFCSCLRDPLLAIVTCIVCLFVCLIVCLLLYHDTDSNSDFTVRDLTFTQERCSRFESSGVLPFGKGKGRPSTCHERPEGELRYSSTLL